MAAGTDDRYVLDEGYAVRLQLLYRNLVTGFDTFFSRRAVLVGRRQAAHFACKLPTTFIAGMLLDQLREFSIPFLVDVDTVRRQNIWR